MPTFDFDTLTTDGLTGLTNVELADAANRLLREQSDDRREHQLLFYQPVSEKARDIHMATETVCGVGGGNRASKTDTCLADLVIRSTGIVPKSLQADYPMQKLRGPINVRVVCESLTTTMHPVILSKLQWWKWNGMPPQGGPQGHWGWIPRNCLINGSWEKSWTEKLRRLVMYYRNPEKPDEILGESTWQIMSLDQDVTDFASGEFHVVLHDEPPSKAIFDENKMRVMSLNGHILLAMTWPDDPGIPVDWIYDDVYEKGMPGPAKDVNIKWIEIVTTENPNIDQQAVAETTKNLTALQKTTRIAGKPIRFSNLMHPLFTDIPSVWCFFCACETSMLPDNTCATCHSQTTAEYCHVVDEPPVARAWPTIMLIDPHPRKPHILLWVQVDPADDLWVVAEAECEGGPGDVHKLCDDVEIANEYLIAQRLMDPNMGASPGESTTHSGVTNQTEFDRAGVRCDLADDSAVGRNRLNDFLKPDPRTRRPRVHIASRCYLTIYQMKRYTWDDNRRQSDHRDIKQKPKGKHDDRPTLLKYLMNSEPNFRFLKQGPQVWRPHANKRRGPLGY